MVLVLLVKRIGVLTFRSGMGSTSSSSITFRILLSTISANSVLMLSESVTLIVADSSLRTISRIS